MQALRYISELSRCYRSSQLQTATWLLPQRMNVVCQILYYGHIVFINQRVNVSPLIISLMKIRIVLFICCTSYTRDQ